ncbi:MAG: acyl-CoA thioesterase [Synergistaceae bacterium]|jgi:acyl-CoA thioester hydrolase|nr:acyl-CoA thioesterase [Synergistaceae bacterium]
MARVFLSRQRVRYAETDQMGVVYHANYFVWFEAARGEFCRDLGISVPAMEASGLMLPVVEAHCRYKSPARYDDVVRVETVLAELKKHSVTFGYRLFREGEKKLLVEGTTRHGFCDLDGKLTGCPDAYRVLFESCL